MGCCQGGEQKEDPRDQEFADIGDAHAGGGGASPRAAKAGKADTRFAKYGVADGGGGPPSATAAAQPDPVDSPRDEQRSRNTELELQRRLDKMKRDYEETQAAKAGSPSQGHSPPKAAAVAAVGAAAASAATKDSKKPSPKAARRAGSPKPTTPTPSPPPPPAAQEELVVPPPAPVEAPAARGKVAGLNAVEQEMKEEEERIEADRKKKQEILAAGGVSAAVRVEWQGGLQVEDDQTVIRNNDGEAEILAMNDSFGQSSAPGGASPHTTGGAPTPSKAAAAAPFPSASWYEENALRPPRSVSYYHVRDLLTVTFRPAPKNGTALAFTAPSTVHYKSGEHEVYLDLLHDGCKKPRVVSQPIALYINAPEKKVKAMAAELKQAFAAEVDLPGGMDVELRAVCGLTPNATSCEALFLGPVGALEPKPVHAPFEQLVNVLAPGKELLGLRLKLEDEEQMRTADGVSLRVVKPSAARWSTLIKPPSGGSSLALPNWIHPDHSVETDDEDDDEDDEDAAAADGDGDDDDDVVGLADLGGFGAAVSPPPKAAPREPSTVLEHVEADIIEDDASPSPERSESPGIPMIPDLSPGRREAEDGEEAKTSSPSAAEEAELMAISRPSSPAAEPADETPALDVIPVDREASPVPCAEAPAAAADASSSEDAPLPEPPRADAAAAAFAPPPFVEDDEEGTGGDGAAAAAPAREAPKVMGGMLGDDSSSEGSSTAEDLC
eukprot:TRINITY_DN483_c1_g2_i5.p1 TRINITY_DN483_c1_g2~~TRINITY_DN483_c1_g2_i5.p1  ORF type:complete len:725 (+),score=304.07 TRINITY_DN483_c1_g2_i5:144-2318(+)